MGIFKSCKRIDIDKTKAQCLARIKTYIRDVKSIRCGILRRRVFLSRFVEANNFRNKERLQTFFAALEIIQKSKLCKEVYDKSERKCFRMLGMDVCGEIIEVHLREEMENKDRKLYFISSYPNKKALTHDI
jgi:hypothetical protein